MLLQKKFSLVLYDYLRRFESYSCIEQNFDEDGGIKFDAVVSEKVG
jgi:hypothetical protein